MLRELRLLLASKKLFANWLEAGFRFNLVKYKVVRNGVIVKCDGRRYELSPRAYGWILRANVRGVVKGVLCSNYLTVNLNLGNIPASLTVLYDRFLLNYGGMFLLIPTVDILHDVVFENLVGGAYDDLNVVNKVVVDVGAGIGDTVILFLSRGARTVIALEPFPSLYKLMETNVKLNNIGGKVNLLNAALGPSDAEICNFVDEVLGYRQFKPGEARGGECKERVKVYTLDSLVSMFDIENAILKVDCEGCEYETILTTRLEILKLFNQIVIEYHNGYWRLKRVLEEAGFKTIIKPMRSSNVPIKKHGYIVALRDTPF